MVFNYVRGPFNSDNEKALEKGLKTIVNENAVSCNSSSS